MLADIAAYQHELDLKQEEDYRKSLRSLSQNTSVVAHQQSAIASFKITSYRNYPESIGSGFFPGSNLVTPQTSPNVNIKLSFLYQCDSA
ncbi:MAG: hypothetical protein F6K47_30615 [Symploca sp. SIO2E6]|nr:hypothetical protein [Symploca sp. SIO2E6]